MKQHIQEALSNLDNMIEVDAVANPVTAQLKKDMKKKYDDFKDMTETDDNYLGAKKQPVPKKVEVPKSEAKLDLSESLFEDLDNSDYNDLRSNVYNALSNIMYKYQIEKELPISKFDLDNAINWFNDNFWAEPDEEDDLDEALKEPSISDLTKVKDVDEDVSIFVDEYTNVYYIVDETNQTILDGGFKSDKEAIDLYTEYMGNESLKEDYSEDELEQAINIVKKYYHNNLHSFLESFVFNCPIADGGEIIKELADYIDEHDDYIDESLKESRQNNINDYIRELHRSHPALDTADEMIEYLEDNDEIEELEDSFMTDVIGAIEEYFEDLDEALKKNYAKIPTTNQLIELANSLGFEDENDDNSPWFMNGDLFALDFYRGSKKDTNKLINAIKKHWRNFTGHVYDDGTPIFISGDGNEVGQLDECFNSNSVNLNEKREKVIQTPEERAEEGSLWTTVYNELSGDASFFKPSLGSRGSKYGREKSNSYPKYEEILPTDTGMRIYGSSEEDFDFAKQVADDYDLYYWVDENENNFDDDPNRQYYIDIDIEQ